MPRKLHILVYPIKRDKATNIYLVHNNQPLSPLLMSYEILPKSFVKPSRVSRCTRRVNRLFLARECESICIEYHVTKRRSRNKKIVVYTSF